MPIKKLFCLLPIAFFIFSLNCLAKPINQKSPAGKTLPTIVVVSTGGTIAEKSNVAGAAVPALTGDDLIAAVPPLKNMAHIQVVNFSNIDSSHMTPQIWANLSKKVDQVLKNPKVKGVIITHGTDTMAIGAYLLDLTLKSNKPVVFTGAMRDASSISPDGPINILNSAIEVLAPQAKPWGVTINMNDYVTAAQFARKTQTTNPQTFDGGEKGYLGYVMNGKLDSFHVYNHTQHYRFPIPKTLPKVVLITEYAGSDGSLIKYAADSEAKGIVIQALGAGNVGIAANKAILYALTKHIPVVLTSRVANGSVYPLYGDAGGSAALAKHGVILAHDLNGPKARIVLMLALPLVHGNFQKLPRYFALAK